jgi:hypothetical protein
VDESALAVYNASCENLEELGYSVEERPAELEIMLVEDETPYDGEAWIHPAAFLSLGAVPLNELTEIVDVRPVREEIVCCALVSHKVKEGSLWWKICGGTGSHTHQGKKLRWTSPTLLPHAGEAGQSANLYDGHSCVQQPL